MSFDLHFFQSYTASVLEGSNPTFKWTVDDKPFFTYYNTVLNVIYQHADVYKLTVSLFHMYSFLPSLECFKPGVFLSTKIRSEQFSELVSSEWAI